MPDKRARENGGKVNLDLQQPGTLAPPGIIGRGLRLIIGLWILFAIMPLVTQFRPGDSFGIDNFSIWFGLFMALWVSEDVINVGFGRDFGHGPRYGIIILLILGALADYLTQGVFWGDKLALAIAGVLVFVLGYLGISFVTAAALAVPG